MKSRTEALRALEKETRLARERFEQEARKRPGIWKAYQRDLALPIGDRFASEMKKQTEQAPELYRLWSHYMRLKCSLKVALSRPSWPEIVTSEDPTPPSGKRSP